MENQKKPNIAKFKNILGLATMVVLLLSVGIDYYIKDIQPSNFTVLLALLIAIDLKGDSKK